jgi:hypothetical protein
MTISRGPSYAGHESPIPRTSTSSSSLVIPSVGTSSTTTNNPINMSSSPRGSHQQYPSGSPSSFSELERRRASSFGDAKPKGYRPI